MTFGSKLTAQYQTTLGVTLGYTSMSMQVVNNDLNAMYDFAKSLDLPISAPEEINAGFLWGGQILFRARDYQLGLSADRLTRSGEVIGEDETGRLKEYYKVGTTEIMVVLGFTTSVSEMINLIFRVHAGLGLADLQYRGTFKIYDDDDSNIDLDENTSNNYIASRFQFGVEVNIWSAIANASLSYRFSNAGSLIDQQNLYGSRYGEEWINSNSTSIEFDLSGYMFSIGIDIPVWGSISN
jgi:hypothetical protein